MNANEASIVAKYTAMLYPVRKKSQWKWYKKNIRPKQKISIALTDFVAKNYW